MSVTVGVAVGYTRGCCGVKQLEGFSFPDDDTSDEGWDITATGKTVEEAYQNLFDEFYGERQQHFGDTGYNCAVVQMWFRKSVRFDKTYEDEYLAEPLRKLVEQIPGVIELGEFVNPNSDNIIKGYQWAV